MKLQTYSSQLKSVVICVDSYEGKILSGRVYDRYPDEGFCFHSTIELLRSIEAILDKEGSPQPFCSRREFWSEPERPRADREPGISGKGFEATFTVQILFRQNASWQGSILWVERKREESFRSVLELLLLMDNALSSSEEV